MKNQTSTITLVASAKGSKSNKVMKSTKAKNAKLKAVTLSDEEQIFKEMDEALEDSFFNAFDAEDGAEILAHKPFGERLSAAKTRGDDWGSIELSAAVGALLEKAQSEFGDRNVKTLVRSPAGMRLLVSVSSQIELRAYCRLLAFGQAELDALTKGDVPANSFRNLPLLSAAGVWAQTTRQEQENNTASSADIALADAIFAALGEMDSFKFGRNMARRIWDGSASQVASRGRRSKGHMDSLFTAPSQQKND